MKSLQKGFILNLAIIIIILISLAALYFYQKQAPVFTETLVIDTNTSVDASKNTSTSTAVSKPAVTKVSPTPTQKDDSECINTYKARSNEYLTKGQLTVFFATSTSLADAEKIIASYGLISSVPYGSNSKLYVEVPTDQEFTWACKLKRDKNIRSADPSYSAGLQQ